MNTMNTTELTGGAPTAQDRAQMPPRSAGAAPVAAVYDRRYSGRHGQHWSLGFGWSRSLRDARKVARDERRARREAHALYLARVSEAVETVRHRGPFESYDGPRGGVLRLPSWPLNVWVAAATVTQRAGVATAAP